MTISRRAVLAGALGTAILTACGEREVMKGDPTLELTAPAGGHALRLRKVASWTGLSPYGPATAVGDVIIARKDVPAREEKTRRLVIGLDTKSGKSWQCDLDDRTVLGDHAQNAHWTSAVTGTERPLVLVEVELQRERDQLEQGVNVLALDGRTGAARWTRPVVPLSPNAREQVRPFGGNDDTVVAHVTNSMDSSASRTVALDARNGAPRFEVRGVRPIACTRSYLVVSPTTSSTSTGGGVIRILDARSGKPIDVPGLRAIAELRVHVVGSAAHDFVTVSEQSTSRSRSWVVDLRSRKVLHVLDSTPLVGTGRSGRPLTVVNRSSVATREDDESLTHLPSTLPTNIEGGSLNAVGVVEGAIWCVRSWGTSRRARALDRSGGGLSPEVEGMPVALSAGSLCVAVDTTTGRRFDLYRVERR